MSRTMANGKQRVLTISQKFGRQELLRECLILPDSCRSTTEQTEYGEDARLEAFDEGVNQVGSKRHREKGIKGCHAHSEERAHDGKRRDGFEDRTELRHLSLHCLSSAIGEGALGVSRGTLPTMAGSWFLDLVPSKPHRERYVHSPSGLLPQQHF